MAKKSEAKHLPNIRRATPKHPVIGVFATSDPRIGQDDRKRCQNIAKMAADCISGAVVLPDNTPVDVVYSTVLVDSEAGADIVAQQFRKAGVDILVCVPDTWAFPQLTTISLLQQFPPNTPLNITCGNSGPRPGVVYAHATAGALAQYGRMVSLNVGTWPDTGLNPQMTQQTAKNLSPARTKGPDFRARLNGNGNRPGPYYPYQKHFRPRNHPPRYEALSRHAHKESL
jgi:L-fucose isomerase